MSMASTNAEGVRIRAQREASLVSDDLVRDALRAMLIQPELHFRNWDYGEPGERYPCWTVARDEASDTAIVYS
jgi:hypothetical protein